MPEQDIYPLGHDPQGIYDPASGELRPHYAAYVDRLRNLSEAARDLDPQARAIKGQGISAVLAARAAPRLRSSPTAVAICWEGGSRPHFRFVSCNALVALQQNLRLMHWSGAKLAMGEALGFLMGDVCDLRWSAREREGSRADGKRPDRTEALLSRPVLVSDVSARGARLSGKDLPPQETSICLRVDDQQIAGRIAWSIGTECGIEFIAPLDAASLARYRRRGVQGQLVSA